MGLSMNREMQEWSRTKVRREENRAAMTERLNLPLVNQNAVFMKPKGQPAVRKNKFFVDEDDFLSIESSLKSSEMDESEKGESPVYDAFDQSHQAKVRHRMTID